MGRNQVDFCIFVVGSAISFSFSQGVQHAAHAAQAAHAAHAPGCSWKPLAAVSNWGSPTADFPFCPFLDLWLLVHVFVISCQLWSRTETRAGMKKQHPVVGVAEGKVTPWTACITASFWNLSTPGWKMWEYNDQGIKGREGGYADCCCILSLHRDTHPFL